MAARPLLHWLEEPPADRGIRFLQPDRSWAFHGYAELAGAVFATAERLRADGVRAGDLVCVATDQGPEFVSAFFGALVAGASPAPLAPPTRFENHRAYRARLEHILRVARPAAVVTTAAVVDRWRAAGVADLLPDPTVVAHAHLAATVARQSITAPDRALVQFTSGSSGAGRAVAVSREALEANVGAIAGWLGMTPRDGTATWLPLHHDMGLVGCFLTPVTHTSELWMMRPDEFVRYPALWLRLLGSGQAGLTAMPNFGLAHILRRVRAAEVSECDFSAWRALIVGAEHISARVLADFHRLLAPHGFSARTFLPAYGLAEAVLAVTGLALDRDHRTVTVERGTLVQGAEVGLRPADPASTTNGGTATFVGCGHALGRTEVAVVDEHGDRLPDGTLGEITVGGPATSNSYLRHDAEAGHTTFTGTGIRTGDAGFLLEGELFVVGRLGDSVKRRAHTIFAEDLETLVGDIPGLGDVRPVVLLGAVRGTETAVVIARKRPGAWAEEAVGLVHRETEGMPTVVCADPNGVTQRTSSGKPRRRLMWEAYLRGDLDEQVVARG